MIEPKQAGTPGDTLYQVIVEVAAVFFRLRAAGKSAGLVTPWGGGIWGFLRSLKLQGPATVPQLARLRPVARQRIQRLADEAAAEGLVAFQDNPAHKRSKLVCLTPKGEAVFAEMDRHLAGMASELAGDLDPAELRTALKVLRQLRDRLRPD